MKELFRSAKKKLRKQGEAAGVAIAFLLLVLFAGIVTMAFRGQKEHIPENPITGQEKSSMVMLTGTKEVLAEQKEEPESEKNEKNTTPTQQEEETEKTTESSSTQESDNVQQSTEQSSGGQAVSATQNTGSSKQESEASFGGESDKEKKEKNNKKKEENGKKDQQYFRTTIKNNSVVTEATYTYEIEQLTSLKVKKTENTLNDGRATAYRGSLKLAHGENKILVAVTYQEKDGTEFTVSKEYTVYYDQEILLIHTNLKDQTNKTGKISFRAWAALGKEEFALTAFVNGTVLTPDDQWNYNDAMLQEGENTILLHAEKAGQTKEEIYHIYYERPQNQQIRFDTDLEDKEVTRKKYHFYAQAFMGSEEIENFTVECNGQVLAATQERQYEVLLEEGENQIVLYAEKDGVSESISYQVTYIKQITGDGDGEGNEEAPKVTCTLGESGSTLEVERKSLSFQVKPYDYHGNGLGAAQISISCFGDNGDNVTGLIWENSGDVSYHAELSPGYNTMIIRVTDTEDNMTELTYSIFCTAKADGERIGTVHISVEATTVGSGMILSQDTDIYEGETAAETMVRLLQENGFSVEYTGNYESNFYLARINSSTDFVTGKIPDELRTKLEEHDFEIYDFSSNSLGDYDFTKGSGWMYQVNGVYPNYGLSDYCFQNGDTLRLRFTLAYGADIGQDVSGGKDDWGYEW